MSYEQYSAAYADALAKYGDRSIVWMEVGSFYEMYGVQAPRTDCSTGRLMDMGAERMRHVCGILEVTMTKKNKSNPDCDPKNPFMAGFPSYMLDKYLGVIVDEGYTVVLMEQQKTRLRSPRTGKESAGIFRAITRVISPGTFIPEDQGSSAAALHGPHRGGPERVLMAVRLERVSLQGGSRTYVFGMACIDIATGKTVVHEPHHLGASPRFDTRMLKEDLYRMLVFFGPPKEVYVFTDAARGPAARSKAANGGGGGADGGADSSGGPGIDELAGLLRYISDVCGDKTVVHNRMDEGSAQLSRLFCRTEYQNTMLRKVWQDNCSKSILTPLEVFGLERHALAASALCALLQFVYDHGDFLIRSVRPPTWWQHHRAGTGALQDAADGAPSRLNLNYTSASQLDLTDTGGGSGSSPGFLGMFNKCLTMMGKRLFRDRVLSPSCDALELQQSYDITDSLIASGAEARLARDFAGAQVPDLERLTRRLCMGRVSAQELYRLANAAGDCVALLDQYVHAHGAFALPGSARQQLQNLRSRITAVMQEPENGCLVIRPGVDARIDELGAVVDQAMCACKTFADGANAAARGALAAAAAAGGGDLYKLECGDRDGYYVSVTQKRHADVCKGLRQAAATAAAAAAAAAAGTLDVMPDALERVPGSSSVASSLKLTHPRLKEANACIAAARSELQDLQARLFQGLVAEFGDAPGTEAALRSLADAVALLDFHGCVARHAVALGWTRPCVEPPADQGGGAWVAAEGLRHPIIEQVLSSTGLHSYVPNDVCLGHNRAQSGILLYGINASGKSSLMKSVGVAIVMAQAGMHVPAARFQFVPYREIFTRIVSVDNMYAGRSTFTNEILELRNILRRASTYSLVLGDELCSGTESISAMSIVGAGIKRLAREGCTYLFATHLHELTRIGILDDVERLRVCHLAVTYSAELDGLVYDRVLKDGPGEALYGLEVCQSLDLDEDFMQLAAGIRKRITGAGELLVSAKQSRYSGQVFMDLCEMCGNELAQETHHLVPQVLADARGLLEGRYHKNARWNLMCLCRSCHDQVHRHSPATGSSSSRPPPATHRRVLTTRGARVMAPVGS